MPVNSLLKPEIKQWLQKSIESELYAHFLYSQIANELQRLGYFGAEKFFRHESHEEFEHYMIIVNYMNDMGDCAIIPQLPAVPIGITSLPDALFKAYKTELGLLKQYHDLYKDAEEYEDCVTGQFVLQFLEIQKKSVGLYADLISRYELGGDKYIFDKEMGKLAE